MEKHRMIQYALNKNDELVFIDNVPNGNNCECRCSFCKEPLNARNGGTVNIHHFAHLSGTDCTNAFERTVHLLAKQIIAEEQRIPLFDNNEQPENILLKLIQLVIFQFSKGVISDNDEQPENILEKESPLETFQSLKAFISDNNEQLENMKLKLLPLETFQFSKALISDNKQHPSNIDSKLLTSLTSKYFNSVISFKASQA